MKVTKNCSYVIELTDSEYKKLVDALGEAHTAYEIYDALDDAR